LNFNTAVDISTAMISGQIDIGLLTPIHLIRAIDTNVDFVQIAGNTRGNTGIIVAKKLGLAQDDWDGLKKLTAQKKLKVASSRGSINEMLAIAEFAKHGINVDKDLDLVNIANFAQHPQALRSGDFDMIVTLEPLATISLVEGTGILFARPYSTEAGDLNTNYCVRREWLAKNADKAKAYVATLAEASARLGNDKGAEMEAAIKLTGLKPEVLTTALSNSRYELRNGLAQMQELARLALERRYTSRNVAADLPKHVDGQFLKAAGIND
jgi:ABC-type nitrate/sulfonate/bicarbonate transport system substrate-binding protein